MKLIQGPVVNSLKQASYHQTACVHYHPMNLHLHMFAKAPYAQVTMYRCQSLSAQYEICNTLSFDISQKSSARIYDLAKFYFKPDSQEEELLLKLVLSESRVEGLEFKKQNDPVSYGLRFQGCHNFMKSRVSPDEKKKILENFLSLDSSPSYDVTNSYTIESDQKRLAKSSSVSKWEELLHMAFITTQAVQWLALSKANTGCIQSLAKRLT